MMTNSFSHGYAVPAPSRRELFFWLFSVYAISQRDFSKVSAVKRQYLPLRGRWLPKADGRRKKRALAFFRLGKSKRGRVMCARVFV